MKNKIYILLFIIGLSYSSCKKYSDGGFYKQGPKTFINYKKAQWKLSLYEVNGVDSTYLIQTPMVSGNDFYKDFLYCNYINKKENNDLYANNHNYNYLIKFTNKNAQISFENGAISQCLNTSTGVSCQRNIFNPEGTNKVLFTILKLKDNECILTTQLNNSYKIILTRNN
jgi:hypothetical protein